MCISCIRRTIFLVISTLVSFIVLRKGSNLILFAFLASSVLYLYASRRIWGSGFCLVCLLVKFAKAFFHLPKWFCQIRKGIFSPSEMPLSISQSHFSAFRNAFVNFAIAFFPCASNKMSSYFIHFPIFPFSHGHNQSGIQLSVNNDQQHFMECIWHTARSFPVSTRYLPFLHSVTLTCPSAYFRTSQPKELPLPSPTFTTISCSSA